MSDEPNPIQTPGRPGDGAPYLVPKVPPPRAPQIGDSVPGTTGPAPGGAADVGDGARAPGTP
ncbi:MAG TPA: hypothetical protein VJM33_14945, partial [Microthrixaceae bacterium]|nr:hypothetical protein [Microthrixaceae bacterium]